MESYVMVKQLLTDQSNFIFCTNIVLEPGGEGGGGQCAFELQSGLLKALQVTTKRLTNTGLLLAQCRTSTGPANTV